MEKIKLEDKMVKAIINLSKPTFWSDYDNETDTLYLSFRKPQQANDSIMEDNFIYHYDDDKLVGVTILNANKN